MLKVKDSHDFSTKIHVIQLTVLKHSRKLKALATKWENQQQQQQQQRPFNGL